jgi:hypothetical protein
MLFASFILDTQVSRVTRKSKTKNKRAQLYQCLEKACKQQFSATTGTIFHDSHLQRGGSVFHLQKVLGRSTLEMTRRYANLVSTDLQAVHERVSLVIIALGPSAN